MDVLIVLIVLLALFGGGAAYIGEWDQAGAWVRSA